MRNRNNQLVASFIIVGWNNKSLLDECFRSLQEQSCKYLDVIYVDNGSTDGSVASIKKQYPDVTILELEENLGFAVGNNLGIKAALKNESCQYVALINSDARISPDWLEKLVDFAEQHPQGASFQSPTYDYYDHSILDSRGITIDHYGRAVQLGHRDKKPKLTTKQVFGVNAAAALYSRAFLEAQPFGEDYFDSDMWMYLEDVDLAARATVTGWENWFVNESSAYHMGSATSGKNPGFSVYMVYRNSLPLLLKNLPFWVLTRTLPRLVYSDIESLFRLWRHRNYRAMKSIVKGRLHSLPILPTSIRKRRVLKHQARLSARTLWKLMGES